jgi:hypothetical protein
MKHSKRLLVAILSVAALMLATTAALAEVSIDTITGWDGTSFISSFGVPDTATYGQTVLVAPGASPLSSFSFEIGNCGAPVTLRGSVYAWDGTKASGPSLFTSGAQTIPVASTYQLVTFNAGSLTLPPGGYVLFASTSQDQTGAPSSACRWGAISGNSPYPYGQFVFQNNGTNTGMWTATPWSTIAYDLALRVDGLYVAPATVPTASTWALLALAVLLGATALLVLRRLG